MDYLFTQLKNSAYIIAGRQSRTQRTTLLSKQKTLSFPCKQAILKKIKQARRYNGRRYNCAILVKRWSGSETQHQDQSYNKESDRQRTTRRKENFSALMLMTPQHSITLNSPNLHLDLISIYKTTMEPSRLLLTSFQ